MCQIISTVLKINKAKETGGSKRETHKRGGGAANLHGVSERGVWQKHPCLAAHELNRHREGHGVGVEGGSHLVLLQIAQKGMFELSGVDRKWQLQSVPQAGDYFVINDLREGGVITTTTL